MNFRFKGLLAVSLLSGTALATPALAQQQQPQQDPALTQEQPGAQAQAGDEACQQLVVVIDEQRDTFQQEWIDQATIVAQQGNPQDCTAYVQAAEEALGQGDNAEQIEGRIVVSQPAPQVTVQQEAPEITVVMPEPSVTVNQAEPEIIVRQRPPTVRIEMPRPVVTIEQPEPEIVVNMPDPEVSIDMPQPEVQVQQAQPRVEVQQQEPQVDLQVEQADAAQAEVQVQQQQPRVTLQEQGNPQVQLQRAQPRVVFEPAEPIIEFVEGGEPEVQFQETGPSEDQAALQQEQQPADQQVMQDQQVAQGQEQVPGQMPEQERAAMDGQPAPWRGGRDVFAPPAVEREGYQLVEANEISLDNMIGAQVYSVNDENMGEISDVVVGQSGQAEYVVVEFGGFLGIGSREVAVGFDEVTVLRDEGWNDVRVYMEATQEQLEAAPEYEQQL